jgi:hypothetical protein
MDLPIRVVLCAKSPREADRLFSFLRSQPAAQGSAFDAEPKSRSGGVAETAGANNPGRIKVFSTTTERQELDTAVS